MLARRDAPLPAKEIQRRLLHLFPGDRVPAVTGIRAALRDGPGFVQPGCYRWQFGREAGPWRGAGRHRSESKPPAPARILTHGRRRPGNPGLRRGVPGAAGVSVRAVRRQHGPAGRGRGRSAISRTRGYVPPVCPAPPAGLAGCAGFGSCRGKRNQPDNEDHGLIGAGRAYVTPLIQIRWNLAPGTPGIDQRPVRLLPALLTVRDTSGRRGYAVVQPN